MSAFVSCDLIGGLGNQLFQIFATISYSLKYHKDFKFQSKDFVGNRKTYWNDFLVDLKCHTRSDLENIFHIYVRELAFNYIEIPYVRENIILYGYFQSYKYFEDNIDEIYSILNIDERRLEYKGYKNFISIHFRIGDYKNQQNFHPVQDFNYYKKALELILVKTNTKGCQILCCFEKNDEKDVDVLIGELQKTFKKCIFVKINHNLEDWEQMLVMSNCDHNIICNSTFSWWSAYLNPSDEKIVCYPKQWFGVDYSDKNTCDLFPRKWTMIDSSCNIDIVYYINIENRKDRNESFLQWIQLSGFNMDKVCRFDAIYNQIGFIGCAMSHIKTLEKFIDSDHNVCVVYEDDYVPLESVGYWSIFEKLFEDKVDFDMVLCSYNDCDLVIEDCEYSYLKRVFFTFTTSGYLITKSFARILKANFVEGLQETIKCFNLGIVEHRFSLDMYWEKVMKEYKCYCFYPRIGKQNESYSDIEHKVVDYEC